MDGNEAEAKAFILGFQMPSLIKTDWIADGLAVVAAVWTTVNWWLQKKMEARLAKQLEGTKHEFQDKLQKLSIVYEHQKDSFKGVLSAMHDAIRCIERNIRGVDDEWGSVRMKDYEAFRRAVAEEVLFVDARTERALSLFSEIFWDAVDSPEFDQFTDSEKVRRSHGHMEFISDRIAEYFRLKVGLASESPDPLLEIELLGACRLINEQHFAKAGLPTKTMLKFNEHTSAEEIISMARQNAGTLRSELEALRGVLAAEDSKSSFYYNLSTRVARYLASVESLDSQK